MPSRKRRILIFIDWFLPGFKAGGPVRSIANLTEHFNFNLDFYIITRNTEYLEHIPYPNIISDTWCKFSHGVKVYYCSKGNTSLKKWSVLIKEVEPDTVYINGIYSLWFSVLPVIAAKLQRVPRILVAPRGMLANSAINVKKGRKIFFLKLARLAGLYKNVYWHVTNEGEQTSLKNIFGYKTECFIAPNLPKKVLAPSVELIKTKGNLQLCSMARISPEKNSLFAIECLSEIKSDLNIVFDLYGQVYNEPYWATCEKLISRMPKNVSVNYRGVVKPEKVSETLGKYHALFLPSCGENFGHVILESFMAGRPVIISDQTPWVGLNEKMAGWDISLSSTENFSDIIEKFAEIDQAGFDKLCNGALKLASEIVNNANVKNAYLNMFDVNGLYS